MSNVAERFTAIGEQRGVATVLLRRLPRTFGAVPETTRRHVEATDRETLLAWSGRILSTERIDEVRH